MTRTALGLEPLEARENPAINCVLAHGILSIAGTDQPDLYVVTAGANAVTISSYVQTPGTLNGYSVK